MEPYTTSYVTNVIVLIDRQVHAQKNTQKASKNLFFLIYENSFFLISIIFLKNNISQFRNLTYFIPFKTSEIRDIF